MRLVCPNCAAAYEVADTAVGPQGRKVRCRACGTSWLATPPAAATPLPGAVPPDWAMSPPPAPPPVAAPPPEPEPTVAASDFLASAPPFAARSRAWRGPLLLGLLVCVVLALGVAAAFLAWGPRQVAGALGLAERPVPLGIAITRQPDWRMIAGGSELFAVSGRIWNPTGQNEPVPDILAELKDQKGKTVYSWTITHPVARLGPGQSVDFDGAAVDVPRASQRIAVSFVKSAVR